jgi:hypothetical protein
VTYTYRGNEINIHHNSLSVWWINSKPIKLYVSAKLLNYYYYYYFVNILYPIIFGRSYIIHVFYNTQAEISKQRIQYIYIYIYIYTALQHAKFSFFILLPDAGLFYTPVEKCSWINFNFIHIRRLLTLIVLSLLHRFCYCAVHPRTGSLVYHLPSSERFLKLRNSNFDLGTYCSRLYTIYSNID